MKCEKCGGNLKVIGSIATSMSVYRRRRCKNCGHIQHSTERVTPHSEKQYVTAATKRREYYAKQEIRNSVREKDV